jgi:hypothetical protein
MKTIMGAVNGHLKSGKKIFENNKKQFLLGLDKKSKKNYGGKNNKLLLKNKVIGKKSGKTSEASKISNKKSLKIDKNAHINNKNSKVLKKSSIKTKNGSKLIRKPTVKNIIISEDRKIEKSRARVLHSLIHAITVAKNLKHIILAKVGFSDFSTVLLVNMYNKKIQLNEMKQIIDDKVIKEVKIVDIHDIDTKENISENNNDDIEELVPTSPYFKLPKVPDLIISLENKSEINISVDDNIQPLISEIISKNSENLDINENENIKIDRNISVNLSLNNLSKSCLDNLVGMINSI